ncbi:hypothetical protein [Allokutzneria oryzae]|uniref:Secreted protein n=1 Tax=Allokutzneria oryzae TaxID=1378989 RepID=A0ABV6AAX8_9PSEU
MGLELTLPPLLMLTTLAVLHRLDVLNRLSFLEMNRVHPVRDLVVAWRTRRTAEALRSSRQPVVSVAKAPAYHGRHRHRGPIVIAREIAPPTTPFAAIDHNASRRRRPRKQPRLGTRGVRRNPVRPGSRHSTAA